MSERARVRPGADGESAAATKSSVASEERAESARSPGSPIAGLGSGTPLDPSLRAPLESSFGTGLADVRVHTDGAARRIADEHSVAAFAYGRDVGFAAGEYRPDTLTGRVMLAHEVAHTVQQRDAVVAAGSSGGARSTGAVSAVRSPRAEHDADRAAAGAIARSLGVEGATAAGGPSARTGLHLAGCDREETPTSGTSAHYDEAMNNLYEASPDEATLEAASPGMTVHMDPEREEVLEHMGTMDAGSIYLFFGHGAQETATGPFVGINANDHTIFGEQIQEALSSDADPPTVVFLGACGSAALLQFVQDAGVPVAIGFSDSVSATLGASVMGTFYEAIMSGDTFAEAQAAANASMSRGGLLNMGGATLEIEYRVGYGGGMTLEAVQDGHRGEMGP